MYNFQVIFVPQFRKILCLRERGTKPFIVKAVEFDLAKPGSDTQFAATTAATLAGKPVDKSTLTPITIRIGLGTRLVALEKLLI